MAFEYNEEQDQFRAVLRRFLEDRSPSSEVRRLMETETGYDPAVWDQMAKQLGVQGLIIPEKFGGLGFGYVELAIAFEEMGRVLLCAPFFSSVALATNALLCSGDEAAMAAYLPSIAAGDLIATLALVEADGSWDPTHVALRADGSDRDYHLSGQKEYVIDGGEASLVLVAARTDAGVGLFAVDGDASGLTRHSHRSLDRTRRLATLTFENVPATPIGDPASGVSVIRRVLEFAAVALAAEQVGGAQHCLDMAVQYAKDRVQFGRAIGSFQAVKHACADLVLEVESARSAAYYAAFAAAQQSEEFPLVASLAKSYCSDAYVKTASDNLQVHGGIGYTWELDCHLYIRRAKSSAYLLGSPSEHRELIAQQIGL